MKRVFGILMFGVAAAVAFYIHFTKLSRNMKTAVSISRVEAGRVEEVIEAGDCEALKKNVAHFVIVEGRITKLQRKGGRSFARLGCLWLYVFNRKIELREGETIRVKGFLKEKNGKLFISVYDEESVIPLN